LCGYEIKNQAFTGFAAGGKKDLWFTHSRPSDKRLVLAESAIDALSHTVLFPDAEDRTCYASLGGKPNAEQPSLVQLTVARLPEGAEIVAAFDADEAGRLLVNMARFAVANVASRTGRNLKFLVHLPTQDGEDWNQVLQRAASPEHRQDQTKSSRGMERDRTAMVQPQQACETSDGMRVTK
jgi:Toprim-like